MGDDFELTPPDGTVTPPVERTAVADAARMVELRGYQLEAVQQAREAIRAGAKNVLIVAPTGSGKTVIASYLIDECRRKGRNAVFVVDRLSLIDQTSATFDRYGIDHGIHQGDHWRWRPGELVQVCSVQTIARRKWPAAHLIVVDEAHTITTTVRKRIEPRDTITIGLTATPFPRGLGKLYDAVVNVTTTDALIEQGFLVPFRIYACEEPDMSDVSVVGGEWEQKEASKRALQVVGDVVSEYMDKGEGRKFICSAVDTAHVEELARQFTAAGISVATYTYKDKADDRSDTVVEFRKPNSSIRGLITVTAASKGFDVPDIGCVIMARPLRNSLDEFIQFFGRGLRISPETGKVDCIVLDHSGNVARFWRRWRAFFALGCLKLDDGKKPESEGPREKEEPEPMTCPQCRALHPPRPVCPVCGHEYPRKKAVEHVPGTLKEILACDNPKVQQKALWPQVCGYVLERARAKEGDNPDMDAAQRRAQAIYRDITGAFAFGRIERTEAVQPNADVRDKIISLNIRRARRKDKDRKGVAA